MAEPQSPNPNTYVTNLLFWLLTGACLLVAGLIVWAAGRGIYTLDESFYLSTYQWPERYAITITSIGYFMKVLFGWLPASIPMYRLLSLFFSLLGGWIFFLGFKPWFDRFATKIGGDTSARFWTTPALCSFILLGNLLTCLIGWRSFGYVNANNFLVLCGSGIFLQYLANTPTHACGRQTLLLLLAGLIVGLDLFIKFPTALLMILPGTLLSVWHTRPAWVLGLRQSSAFWGGFCLGIAVYFGFIQSPQAWQEQFIPFIQETARGNHSTGTMLIDYARHMLSLPVLLVKQGGWLAGACLAGIYFTSRRSEEKTLHKQLSGLLLILFPVLLILLVWLNGYQQPAIHAVKAFWLLLICAALGGIFWSRELFSDSSLRPFLLGLTLLFLLPVVASFGSSVGLLHMIYQNLVPWFAVLACLTELMAAHKTSRRVAVSLTTLTALFAILHGWFGLNEGSITFAHQPLTAQTEDVPALPAMRGLKVDSTTKLYLMETRHLMDKAGFQPGDAVLALTHIPGLVALMNGMPYGGGYYMQGEPFEDENCYLLSLAQPHQRPLFILLQDTISPKLQSCLRARGISIRQDYEGVGSIHTPSGFHFWDNHSRRMEILKLKSFRQ